MDPFDSSSGSSTALRDMLGKKSWCELAQASDTCYTSAAAVMSDVSGRIWLAYVHQPKRGAA